MPLDQEFRRYLADTIHGIMASIPTLKKEYPKFRGDWKFESEFDFLYGCIVGQVLGTGLTAFKMIYEREAASDEILDIGELVESYFPEIRERILRAKS
ncbi:MAG TPA: hypothetical protein VJ792_09215 [Candidatus Nitrosotalea sp.]|nr:hypothetical protein [Candidatus Nitrosotalea sp.]